LLVLALLVCLESNFLLSCGSDAFGVVLDMIGFFDVHLMVHDPTKHIIERHSLIGGVLADQGNHVVVHWCVSSHHVLHQHAVDPFLGSQSLCP
jgi:hypothetical protein